MTTNDMRDFLETGVIDAGRMRAVEGNAVALGYPSLLMMESAGRAVADAVLARNPSRVLVLCGRGNNGGDGMVAARYLQHLDAVDVVYPDCGSTTASAAVQASLLRHCSVTLHPVRCAADVEALSRLFDGADVIVDAMLGTGASGAVREPLASLVARVNASGAPVVAVDIPTPGIRASRIVSFHRPKVEGADVADIGIPLEAEIFTGPGDLTLIPSRRSEAHKGAGGEVLVVGGGPYQGAPYIAAMGALRAGADIVRVASPAYVPMPDLIYERLEGKAITVDHLETILPLVDRADVVVCGMGLGKESHDVVLAVAEAAEKAIFDADALSRPLPAAKETIYTPHAGEFARMTGAEPPAGPVARGRCVKAAATTGTILLKGPVDVISDGSRVRFNRTGTPAMTAGGTGDLLAGIAGALFCHLPAFEAACIAAYVNGRAGMLAAEGRGSGLLATDMPDYIPETLFRPPASD
ncbi:Nicotinamide nucleotide repair protein [Methanoculleus chikugoensis]|uniref:Bifunctional NAD(P)H-hydrate repair enzyme n=1 Tax=Methanoculleus chikugoensis TaxID=118126 RepID=A0A1M4MN60_9EURY|nr:bifunctional ADP-dependent NAD(P)H-hydrate dehydratase/NAD(P)H-hydrate epimerase [Methanoculleus chikugoensis]SCL76355.1 Nicotinamide nucleotide repair protein [Methanoculleus chikugoensis]